VSLPRIAIATCADYADLKVDDELLREALEARGVEAAAVAWDKRRGRLTRILNQHDAMAQPFLPSLETPGELSLVYIAGQLSHAVRKRPARALKLLQPPPPTADRRRRRSRRL
jgi:hypothetical protein